MTGPKAERLPAASAAPHAPPPASAAATAPAPRPHDPPTPGQVEQVATPQHPPAPPSCAGCRWVKDNLGPGFVCCECGHNCGCPSHHLHGMNPADFAAWRAQDSDAVRKLVAAWSHDERERRTPRAVLDDAGTITEFGPGPVLMPSRGTITALTGRWTVNGRPLAAGDHIRAGDVLAATADPEVPVLDLTEHPPMTGIEQLPLEPRSPTQELVGHMLGALLGLGNHDINDGVRCLDPGCPLHGPETIAMAHRVAREAIAAARRFLAQESAR